MKSFERPVRPDECAILFGIPTSEAAFKRHLEQRARHDFVPNVCPAWPAYEQIVEELTWRSHEFGHLASTCSRRRA